MERLERQPPIELRPIAQVKGTCQVSAGALVVLGGVTAIFAFQRSQIALASGTAALGVGATAITLGGKRLRQTELKHYRIKSKPFLTEEQLQAAQTGKKRLIANGATKVYTVDGVEGIVFKQGHATPEFDRAAADERLLLREERLQISRGLCRAFGLDHLRVPDSQLFYDDQGHPIIAEQKLPVPQTAADAEKQFREQADNPEFALAMHQLAEFIGRSEFDDVAFRNLPLIVEGERVYVGLVDVEDMEDSLVGIAGALEGNRWGLLRLLPPELAKDIADRLAYLPREAKEAVKQALSDSVGMWNSRVSFRPWDRFTTWHSALKRRPNGYGTNLRVIAKQADGFRLCIMEPSQ